MTKPAKLSLQTARIRNFKAIRDSGTLRLSPLTVFIGNNGSGKSSIFEALEAFKTLVFDGVDAAMLPWHGFEHAWNKLAQKTGVRKGFFYTDYKNEMSFQVKGQACNEPFCAQMNMATKDDAVDHVVGKYFSAINRGKLTEQKFHLSPDLSIEELHIKEMVKGWQFLNLAPQEMTVPRPKRRTKGHVELAKNGENIAEYMQCIYEKDTDAFNGIIEAMKRVLPYAADIRPRITTGLEKKVYLELVETGMTDKLPGWLFSTGTVRILALLATLRHPQPPSVVFVEEIENGLDPQTLQLLVEEIRYFVQSGTGQVVLTTHSPYLLDLLPLSSLIVVERGKDGAPRFTRPADQKELEAWAKSFAPGKLYTMGSLTHGGAE
jgi:predicted ATPase